MSAKIIGIVNVKSGASRSIVAAILGGFLSIYVHCHAATYEGLVVGVTDGDTIKVLDEKKVQHTVRLAGIDAPEKSQAFGQRSKAYLSELVYKKNILVETNKKDKYGREIGKVLMDGQDINLEQIKRGLAWHYKQYQREQSPADRQNYAAAEDAARESRTGLWHDTAPVSPWEFRHNGSNK